MAATCTRVQLGVYDGPCPSLRLSPYENKIGGYPDFFTNCALGSPPCCKCCGGPLVLLTQVYCPHDGSPYHRLLHVYFCRQPACWSRSECWLVLRSQLRDSLDYELKQEKDSKSSATADSWGLQKQTVSSAGEWCEDVDDWGDGGGGDWAAGDGGGGVWAAGDKGDSGEVGLNSQKADSSIEEASCSDDRHQIEDMLMSMTVRDTSAKNSCDKTCSEVVILPSYEGPYYPPGFISVVEESDTSTSEIEELLKKYKNVCPNFDFTTNGLAMEQEGKKGRQSGRRQKGGCHGDGAGGGGEVYEKGMARHGDQTFQKFHKQLSKFPQQILRYSWKGKPLLFTSDPSHLPPKESALVCKECGAACSFELQLMPTLVYVLNQSLKKEKTRGEPKDSGQENIPRPEEKVVEFGTVLVYSCSVSCWEENLTSSAHFREGIVVVQPDPDTLNKLL